jgi:integrase
MEGMPKPRLPYTHREVHRGQTFWYYRHGHGPRVRLRGGYGSAEFMRDYRAADKGDGGSSNHMGRGGSTFSSLWFLYRSSPAWASLSPATKGQRDNLMRVALERAGDQPLSVWNRKFILASIDARSETPAQARNFFGTLRALFKWAISREHIDSDPTVGVRVERIRGDGFHAWTPDELAKFESHWPLGTRERLAFDIMLWTGLRRSDACRVGPQHVKDGVIVLETAKTGTTVSVRIVPPLARSIEAVRKSPQTSDPFVLNFNGKPFVKEAFGNWFKDACKAAGVPGSCHGLRKALTIRLSQAGATPAEMDALLGWTGEKMSSVYARKANRVTLAENALDRLGEL